MVIHTCRYLALLSLTGFACGAGSVADNNKPALRSGDPSDPGGAQLGDELGGDPGDGPVEPGDAGDAVHACGIERVREELGIPTIDGHALSAFLDRPLVAGCPLPTVLLQTPYDKENAWTLFFGEERSERPLFNSPHYNYVVVDWRGRSGSAGLPHSGSGPWMAQDSYDTVEWIAAQPWSDGKVGTWGVSALCGAQYRTAAGPNSANDARFNNEPPPHLAAMVPIMCPMRPSYEEGYPGGVLRHERMVALDVLGFGMRSIYEDNPLKNWLWDAVAGAHPVERMRVPALVVGGFWDLQPKHTVAAFHELVAGSAPEVREQHRLLLGHWLHFAAGGSISEGAARPLDEEEWAFMDVARKIDRDSLAFFDLHLRAVASPAGEWQAVRFHQENGVWQGADHWPPSDNVVERLYLGSELSLTADAPTSGSRTFPYDPSDPSASIGGATLSPYNCVGVANPALCTLVPDESRILRHGPRSQAPLLARADQLTFQTQALSEPLVLQGEMRLRVEVATTGADTDIAVRVLDIAPDGNPLLIGEGIQRLSVRDDVRSFSDVIPGERVSITVEMLKDFAYTLPIGHSLGLMISGSNWPLLARNPADGAVFHEADVHPETKEEFSYGLLPVRTRDLKGSGVVIENTLFLDGTAFLQYQTTP